MFPLIRNRCLLKDRFDRANRFASAAVDAFFRIDIELVFFLEFFGFVFGWMDAIDRADIDTSGILGIYAGLSNDIGHLFLLESDSSFSSKSTSASQLNVMMRRATPSHISLTRPLCDVRRSPSRREIN